MSQSIKLETKDVGGVAAARRQDAESDLLLAHLVSPSPAGSSSGGVSRKHSDIEAQMKQVFECCSIKLSGSVRV